MTESWYKESCPHCHSTNWVCNGNEMDLTALDIEAIKCRICGKFFWFGFMDEITMEICGYKSPEDSYWEIGQEAPE